MNKETFLKTLEKKLKNLTEEAKKEELKKYQNLKDYNLDPTEEANKIYQARGISIVVTKNQFFNSISTFIDIFKNKDKKTISNLLLFFLYLMFLIIIIKIPFIYIRDMISSIFLPLFTSGNAYTLWYLLIEILYAITTIIIFIRLINNKALEYEKNAS